MHVYTKDNLAFKTRAGKAIGPVFAHNDEFITHVNLDVHQFLADNKVLHEQYSYDAKKEDIRAIVREEIEKYLEAKFNGRIILK